MANNASVWKCCSCRMEIVRMAWRGEKRRYRVLIVSCPKCDTEIEIDLESMIEALGDAGPPDFQAPKGRILAFEPDMVS